MGEAFTRCSRCGDIMFNEKIYCNTDAFGVWRCIYCGEHIDRVILENRSSMEMGRVPKTRNRRRGTGEIFKVSKTCRNLQNPEANMETFDPEKFGMIFCPSCKGNGHISNPERQCCPNCGGFGLIRKKPEEDVIISPKNWKGEESPP